ncbi:OmpA family protein [bacterium]|nr:OmpA family protein [bacterium]
MRENYYNNSKDYINRWIVSYADLITLLLAFFLVLYSVNVTKYQEHKVSTKTEISQTALSDKHTNLEKTIQEKLLNIEDAQLLKDSRGYILRINNDLLFDEGNSELNSKSEETLNKIVEILAKIKNFVIIEGHTDSTPIKTEKYPSNWELSTGRATNLIKYLVEKGNISPERLSAVGYGEYVPVADNTSNNGRKLNRRVDIIILENWIGD